MNEKVENLIKSITSEIEQSWEDARKAQLKEMVKDGGEVVIYNGEVVYDIPALDMNYAVCSDDIINRLNDMEMREEITGEELDYIKDKSDLN